MHNNSAQEKGGGIFVKDNDYLTYAEYSGLIMKPNLLDFIDFIVIEAYNNSALLSGDDIYRGWIDAAKYFKYLYWEESVRIAVILLHLILCAFVSVLI